LDFYEATTGVEEFEFYLQQPTYDPVPYFKYSEDKNFDKIRSKAIAILFDDHKNKLAISVKNTYASRKNWLSGINSTNTQAINSRWSNFEQKKGGNFDDFYLYMIDYSNREVIYGLLADDNTNVESQGHSNLKVDHNAFVKSINDFYFLYDKYMEEQEYKLEDYVDNGKTKHYYKLKSDNFDCWKRFDERIKDSDVKKMVDYINTEYSNHLILTVAELKAYFAQETGDYCMKVIDGILPKTNGYINVQSKDSDKYVGICQLPQYDDATGKYSEATFQEAIDWAAKAGVIIPMKVGNKLAAKDPSYAFKLGVAYVGQTLDYLFKDGADGHFVKNNPNSPKGVDLKCMLFGVYNTGNGTLRRFVEKFDSNLSPTKRYNWLNYVMPFYAKSETKWKWQTECTIIAMLKIQNSNNYAKVINF
jgi:hypothetical protein